MYNILYVSEMISAAEKGDLDWLKRLVQAGEDVNLGNDRSTPLIEAACYGHIDCTHYLIQHGAQVELKGPQGVTAMYYAAANGYHNIVELLLKHKADPNTTGKDRTPLILAASKGHVETVRVLLNHGADLEYRGLEGETALHRAAENGHHSTVEVLLKYKADPNLRDERMGNYPFVIRGFRTPLHLAVGNGHYSTVDLLLQHKADPNGTDRFGNTPLTMAAIEGHVEIVRLLLRSGADVGKRGQYHTKRGQYQSMTPLHWASAASDGYPSTVELLLQYNADPNVTDVRGDTPLITAAKQGNIEIIEVLLKNNADTSIKNKEYKNFADILIHYTTLQRIAEKGCLKTLTLIVDNGVDTENRDCYGKTAVHWAAEKGNNLILDILLQKGANINVIDHEGNSPAILAAFEHKFDTVELLMQNGADVQLVNKQKESAICILKEKLTIFGASENGQPNITMALLGYHDDVTSVAKHTGHNGRTLLHWAAYVQNPKYIDKLLNGGACLNAEDSDRDTALHLALRDHNIERKIFGKKMPQCAKILMERGAEVEGHGEGGRTVLHEAASKGVTDIVELLLKSHVNINMTDDAGNTPLKLALDNEKQKCAMMMIQRGAKLHGHDRSSFAQPASLVSWT